MLGSFSRASRSFSSNQCSRGVGADAVMKSVKSGKPEVIGLCVGSVPVNAVVFAKMFNLRSSLPLIDENWTFVTGSALG